MESVADITGTVYFVNKVEISNVFNLFIVSITKLRAFSSEVTLFEYKIHII